MRVLGVDPGTLRTGAGILDSHDSAYVLVTSTVICSPSRRTLAERLLQIYRRLKDLISEFKPEVLSLENVFFGKDLRAMVKIGEARASAMLAASELGIPVVEYAPARVKQAVTGNGRATKDQMQHMVKTLLGLKALPSPDEADALAVAICHLHSKRFNLCTNTLQEN
ncbi:MAG: crossover junction endodeoxyribonuclease RuvC [Candidatus Omnitrophica bacterium]|nr:crossover junction endodeoxyribonuclease RuvC [Candidatus Omnitrophota bacterium]